MVRTCECGLATDDVALLERHRVAKGHREHVAWPLAVQSAGFRRQRRVDRPAGPGGRQAAG